MSTYSLAMKSWRDKLATEAAAQDYTFPTLSFGYTFDHPFDKVKLLKIVIMIRQFVNLALGTSRTMRWLSGIPDRTELHEQVRQKASAINEIIEVIIGGPDMPQVTGRDEDIQFLEAIYLCISLTNSPGDGLIRILDRILNWAAQDDRAPRVDARLAVDSQPELERRQEAEDLDRVADERRRVARIQQLKVQLIKAGRKRRLAEGEVFKVIRRGIRETERRYPRLQMKQRMFEDELRELDSTPISDATLARKDQIQRRMNTLAMYINNNRELLFARKSELERYQAIVDLNYRQEREEIDRVA